MIFVTVGTHEQQFNRLVQYVDNLKGNGSIEEEVIMQIGYSTYIPKNCKWRNIISYEEMEKNIEEARVIVTHGGPSSFIMVLQKGKIPIVVPRQLEWNEHVNNHQVDFVKAVSERQRNIIPVFDINKLASTIKKYNEIISVMNQGIRSNNLRFNNELEKIVVKLMNEKN